MTRDEKIQTANHMIRFGGSFAESLGKALLYADSENEKKILATWPELISKYKNFLKIEDEN